MAKKNKVRIRILPLKGIGGVGNAGDIAWMDKADADHWVKEGYVEILPDKDKPAIVPSSAADADEPAASNINDESGPVEDGHETVEEHDHDIMKPEARRD